MHIWSNQIHARSALILTDSQKRNINQKVANRRHNILAHFFLHLLRVHLRPKTLDFKHLKAGIKDYMCLKWSLQATLNPRGMRKGKYVTSDLLLGPSLLAYYVVPDSKSGTATINTWLKTLRSFFNNIL